MFMSWLDSGKLLNRNLSTVCMCLRFHAVSQSQSSELDPTKWKYEEASCQLDIVDMQIAEQESILHHFLQ